MHQGTCERARRLLSKRLVCRWDRRVRAHQEVVHVDKPRPHRNVWIGMAVIVGLLLIGLALAYAGGGGGGAGGY
jgi:hypothetical protein